MLAAYVPPHTHDDCNACLARAAREATAEATRLRRLLVSRGQCVTCGHFNNEHDIDPDLIEVNDPPYPCGVADCKCNDLVSE